MTFTPATPNSKTEFIACAGPREYHITRTPAGAYTATQATFYGTEQIGTYPTRPAAETACNTRNRIAETNT